MVTFEQFKALDIRIAKIVKVEDHPNADRLYVVTVEAGDKNTKQVVAGIKQYYDKKDLLNKNIVLLSNLEPAVIRGIRSEGMLLAAKDENGLSVLVPEKDIKIGSGVS